MREAIKIDNEEVPIDQDFTIILGKFEESAIEQYKEKEVDQIYSVLSEIKKIPLINFIAIFKHHLDDFSEFKNGINILGIIQEFHSITNENLNSLEILLKLIEKLNDLLTYLRLKQRKDKLSNDLRLAKAKRKSNNISAKTNLLEKLDKAIKKNKKNLAYLKEDFYKYKNQVDQINNKIQDKNKKIQDQNKKKKQCFRRINSITREMEGKKQEKKDETELGILINDDTSLSKSNRILALQKQARECQYNIKKIRKEVNNLRENLNEILPKYEKMEEDFDNLKESIKNDKKRRSEIQEELNKVLHNNEELKEIDIEEIDIAKSPEQLKREIESVTMKLNQFESKFPIFEKKPKKIITSLRKEFLNLKDKLLDQPIIAHTLIRKAKKEIEKIRTIEQYILDIEKIINRLIKKINLVINFKIKINQNQLEIYPSFIRKGKEKISFEGLTTPEKVYFGICFYLSCFIIMGKKKIIFSNLYLPSDFNKRGSLFRTFRKTIPLFKEDKLLNDFILISLISKLKLKRQIKNAKVINLKNKNK
ncbi:MAG: hypothetical protein ACOC44_08485 [Promethearchaeia archaeon]